MKYWCVLLVAIPSAVCVDPSYAPCQCPKGLTGHCECVLSSHCDANNIFFHNIPRPDTQGQFTEICPQNEKCCLIQSEILIEVPEFLNYDDEEIFRAEIIPTKSQNAGTLATTPAEKTTLIVTTASTTDASMSESEDDPIPLPPTRIDGGCGVRRIVSEESGSSTFFGEFPWMVAVLNKTSRKIASYQCGGALITYQVVLTSAHCVRSHSSDDVLVRAGDWDFASSKEPLRPQDRRVNSIILHPNFNEKTLAYDVALLELKEPLDHAQHVDTICLPDPDSDFTDNDCIAISWGSQGTGRSDRGTVLHKLDLSVLGYKRCRAALRKTKLGKYFRLDKSFLCAVGSGDSACQADGGSPLMCRSARDPQRYILAGILAGSLEGVREAPVLFTNMSVFSSWIFSQFEENDLEYDSRR